MQLHQIGGYRLISQVNFLASYGKDRFELCNWDIYLSGNN